MNNEFLTRKTRCGGFSLVELLVTISIISLLISILLPSFRKARGQCKQVYCQNSLRGIGVGLTLYVNDNEARLPYVDTALWQPPPDPKDWDADPSDKDLYPFSFINVMRDYIGHPKSLICPGAVLGYPRSKYQVTYRIASADNHDGNVNAPIYNSRGGPMYAYSLKYLDGRQYEVRHVDGLSFPLELKKGPGPYYLLRDFNKKLHQDPSDEEYKLAHQNVYNQLYLDMHAAPNKNPDSVTFDNQD